MKSCTSLTISILLIVFTSCKKEESIAKISFSVQEYAGKAKNNTPAYVIGQNFGGGNIIYIDSTGYHGLIAAPNQIGRVQWIKGYYKEIGATETALGKGDINTKLIVKEYGKGDYAAYLCVNSNINGYKDWYLPNTNELIKMYDVVCSKINGDGDWGDYWSSTENATENFQYYPPSNFAYKINWNYAGDGHLGMLDKMNVSAFVRPIRKF